MHRVTLSIALVLLQVISPAWAEERPRTLIGITANTFANEGKTPEALFKRFSQTVETGINFISGNGTWAEFERLPGHFTLGSPQFLASTAQNLDLPISFTIRIIDNVNRTVPSDLQGRSFDSPEMVSRLLDLITEVVPIIRGRARWLILGYEVDSYFRNHPEEIRAFSELFRIASRRVKELAPELRVSTGLTYYGLTELTETLPSLNSQLDFLAITYTPLNPDFTVQAASVLPADFARMKTAAAGRKIVLSEIGYPTSGLNHSSEAEQESFYALALSEFSAAPDSFEAGNFMTLADLTEEDAKAYSSFYDPGNQVPLLKSALQTLGMFDANGRGKPAWLLLSSYLRSMRSQPTAMGDLLFAFSGRGGMSRSTYGDGTLRTGYVRAVAFEGQRAPAGIAILGARHNGVLVSEAAVPASPPVSSGRIYAEVNGTVNTGLAIANSGTKPATLTFEYANGAGTTVGWGTVTLAPGSQVAGFLDQLPFNSAGLSAATLAIVKTFTFRSNVPVSVVALRGMLNERAEFLVTTLPVAALELASTASVILPHYANGGGWRSQVILVNPTDAPIEGTVQFYSQGNVATAGTPQTLTVNGVSSNIFSYVIAGQAAMKFETEGTGPATASGWVKVTPRLQFSCPSAFAVFSYRAGGVTVSETGVQASGTSSAFSLYAEASDSAKTGIAISNATASNAVVTLELIPFENVQLRWPTRITIPANGQIATFLDQIDGFKNLPNSFRGVLRISGAEVSVTGLRTRYNERNDFLISTTPPVNEMEPVSSNEVVFPHFADGGGYTTQFILFSAYPPQGSSGTLKFYDRGGAATNLEIK